MFLFELTHRVKLKTVHLFHERIYFVPTLFFIGLQTFWIHSAPWIRTEALNQSHFVVSQRVDLLMNKQGPEMCLPLEHQNPSKTSEKMGYFDGVTVSLHIL